MSTTPVLPITELDFFQAKNQLKEFLRADPVGRFRDIDFEGSNISVLLDVLSYNTYQNNFYTNMAISEMFLDTAQLENSIVSHVKELNYLPRSAKSARALINITLSNPTSTASVITIPENTRFITSQGNLRFNFFTKEQYIARKVGADYVANGVEIYEGESIEEAFIVSDQRKSIRLVNPNIDITSIRVFENYDQPLDRIEYVYRKDIFGVLETDPIFYIQPSVDETYEITFGKNRFGREPPLNSQIRVFYRITNADQANGSCKFTTSDIQGAVVKSIIAVENAIGGDTRESLEDIKYFAPKSIQVQERAVTERDYEILLKQRFNEIQDISVFGGDELDPPRFGKVAIAVNVAGGLSDIAAKKYESFLRDKTPVGIQPILLPPEYLYVDLTVDVTFSQKQTSASQDSVEKDIRGSLRNYNLTKLNKFGATFELSRVSSIVDSLNPGIINNTISAIPYILYSPEFKQKRSPTFIFGTSLESPCRFSTANRTESYNSFVKSSIFVFDGTEAIFEDNGLGAINIVNARNRDTGVVEIIKRSVGTVDYSNGTVKLSDFIVDFYEGAGIKIFASTQDKNVTAPKQRVLVLDDRDVKVNIREVSDR